jgi:uncharacterized protein YggE
MMLAWMAALLMSAAQEGTSTVTVSAAGKVDKPATALQFTFQLSAKGDDIAKAVEALQERQKSAMESLKKLGAVEKDVVVTVPTLEKKDPNQARMMRQMRSSNRLKKKKEEDKPEKEPAVVMVSVTARVPLQGKDKAALFVESEQFKEKIKAAKLFETEKKEAAEGEEDEEMIQRMQQYQEQSGMEDGFYFQFWAPSDPKDVDAATAKALENAKTLAQAGARASGKSLTAPTGIELSDAGGGAAGMDPEYYYYYQRRGGMPTMPASDGIVSMTLDGLAATVRLKVTFGLK